MNYTVGFFNNTLQHYNNKNANKWLIKHFILYYRGNNYQIKFTTLWTAFINHQLQGANKKNANNRFIKHVIAHEQRIKY